MLLQVVLVGVLMLRHAAAALRVTLRSCVPNPALMCLCMLLQVVLVGVLMLRPQLISKPAALLYDAVKAIVDSSKAQAEVAKSNRGVWRPA
jgi:hypothetical protein